MTESEARYIQRLPAQLEAARRKVAHLENAARRYGMLDLLTDTRHTDTAWNEAIDQGRAQHGFPDVVREAREQ